MRCDYLLTGKTCSLPPDGVNTVTPTGTYKVGEDYNYQCINETYFYGGDVTSTCTTSLTWSLDPPTCSSKIYIAYYNSSRFISQSESAMLDKRLHQRK